MIQTEIADLIRQGTHFTEIHGDKLHVVPVTGVGPRIVISRSTLLEGRQTNLQEITLESGEKILMERGELLPTITRTIQYSPAIIDMICTKLVHGKNLTDICNEPDMPSYALFTRWRRNYPEINEMLENARKDRAEWYRDQAMREAQKADEENLDVQKFLTEANWRAAGVDDGRYSPKAKIEANINQPTQIIVQTGIVRGQHETQKEREATGGTTRIERASRAEIPGQNQKADGSGESDG
jgi:hypothetical protein